MRDKSPRLLVVVLVIGIVLTSQPVVVHGHSPQSGTDSDGSSNDTLIDVIIGAFIGLIRTVADKLLHPITTANQAIGTLVDTPYPDSVFDRPTNGAWPKVYDFYWGMMVPLSLLVWGLAIGIVILLETMGHLFSGYHTAKLKRRSFIGLLGILSWWWLAALSLRFMSALTDVLMPTLGDSLFEVVSAGVMSVIIYGFTAAVNLIIVLLLGIIYLGRHLALYMFVLLIPLLIALWVPGLGPFRPLAQLSAKLGQYYVPFLIMTIPTAMLFRVGELLGHSIGNGFTGFFAWIAGIIVPIFAVIVPLVLFWQAGLLFAVGSRVSRHMSAKRAINRTRNHVQVTRHGGRNTVRGLRDEAPVRPDGQMLLDGGEPRAYRSGRALRRTGKRTGAAVQSTGQRLQTTVTEFRDRLRERVPHDDESDTTPDHATYTRLNGDTSNQWKNRQWDAPSRTATSLDRNNWAAGDDGPQWSDRRSWTQRESRSSGGRDPWRRHGNVRDRRRDSQSSDQSSTGSKRGDSP